MKLHKVFLGLVGLSIAGIFILLAMSVTTIEDLKADVHKFDIEFDLSESNNVKMKCHSGCVWKELSFTMRGSTYVSSYGMESGFLSNQIVKSTDGPLLFRVERDDAGNGIKLTSVIGPEWESVSFSSSDANHRFAVTQSGVSGISANNATQN
ncbi:MAG: hypothetical protein LAT67_08265 [Balneolales bacterium]|nr:hypothetical protein [Balneolales bacterium]